MSRGFVKIFNYLLPFSLAIVIWRTYQIGSKGGLFDKKAVAECF